MTKSWVLEAQEGAEEGEGGYKGFLAPISVLKAPEVAVAVAEAEAAKAKHCLHFVLCE